MQIKTMLLHDYKPTKLVKKMTGNKYGQIREMGSPTDSENINILEIIRH